MSFLVSAMFHPNVKISDVSFFPIFRFTCKRSIYSVPTSILTLEISEVVIGCHEERVLTHSLCVLRPIDWNLKSLLSTRLFA